MNLITENLAPVITIDGTAGSGKGTVSCILSQELGWNFLDSGLLYRGLALFYVWYINKNLLNINLDEQLLASFALNLELNIVGKAVYLKNLHQESQDVTIEIRSEFCANLASKLAVLPMVRKVLLDKQREFLRFPGLVADGRDMGTVVFPKANLKLFLDADPKVRALRRHIQLKESIVDGKLYNRIEGLSERDLRDSKRALAPLKPAKDAICIDTTTMSIDEVYSIIMNQVKLIILR
ncbi:MAG: (d)CMP kinase [Gammaproteobacteria bacterium]